jgi:hypothetical protein
MKTFRLLAAVAVAMWATLGVAQLPPGPPPAPAAAPAPAAGPAARTPAAAPSTGSVEIRDQEPPASRWQADLDRLDAELRLRLLAPNEPRLDWLAGELDTTDPESQVRHYAAARIGAPGERLYLASLAIACLQPLRPLPAACDAVDRLADWARRDGDNGIPAILLAGRARQRGQADAAASFIEQAASAARFDDYWQQGAARWWEYLRTLDVGIDAAAKAEAASTYGAMQDFAWASPLRVLCAEGARSDRMRSGCAALGQAMMARGASFAVRRTGARIAELNAADAASRAAAQSRNARMLSLTARCASLRPDFAAALESSQPAVRTGGVEQFAAWARAQAELGDVAACERVVAAAPR